MSHTMPAMSHNWVPGARYNGRRDSWDPLQNSWDCRHIIYLFVIYLWACCLWETEFYAQFMVMSLPDKLSWYLSKYPSIQVSHPWWLKLTGRVIWSQWWSWRSLTGDLIKIVLWVTQIRIYTPLNIYWHCFCNIICYALNIKYLSAAWLLQIFNIFWVSCV